MTSKRCPCPSRLRRRPPSALRTAVMMSPAPPLVLRAVLRPSELLEYILAHQAHPSTVVVCQSRAAFTTSLLASVPSPNVMDPARPSSTLPDPSPSAEETEQATPPPLSSPRHSLLLASLDQVANSRHTNVVFTATLSHLRAYLAVFPSSKCRAPPDDSRADSDKRAPLLVVYGLLRLHQHTGEWSAQGIGSTLALLVETGRRLHRRTILVEGQQERALDGDKNFIEIDLGETTDRKSFWEEEVPILSGTFIPAGIQTEILGPSGRTVEIGRVLARWFKFSNQI
ncbi:hypothetical protein K3495_g6197 [Podosphaera aphanis]|nr:hypothetical protein K3495_g6197 [Podosphaera aphanis]